MQWLPEDMSKLRLNTRILGIVYIFMLPLLVLHFALILDQSQSIRPIHPAIFVGALLYVGLAPLVWPVIERGMVKKYIEKLKGKKSPYNWAFTSAIIRFSFACVAYCAALLFFVYSRDIRLMLCFYPIGIFWSYKLWPRRGDLDNFLERIEANAT